jgi:putative acetyltransferase
MNSDLVIAVDDPRADDIRTLLVRHLAFANEHSPPEDVHALDLDGLLGPAITFFSARREGALLGIGAIKELTPLHAEVKSMHTAQAARGAGVARALVTHLLEVARERGYGRISLETGSTGPFAPARVLYASVGFTECEPFAEYVPSRHSTFMTLTLD